MKHPPRPRGEGVITRRMWAGIVFVGVVMAAGTLCVLDASLPGGLIEGSGNMRYAQTMAFTTLVMFQLFNVFNARSDERSAFSGVFENHWLWAAIGLSLLLHAAVIYTPFLQQAFSTVDLNLAIGCTVQPSQARCYGYANWARPLHVPSIDLQLGSKAKSNPWGTAGANAHRPASSHLQFLNSVTADFSRREPQPTLPTSTSTSTR